MSDGESMPLAGAQEKTDLSLWHKLQALLPWGQKVSSVRQLHDLLEERDEPTEPLSAHEKELIAAALRFGHITAEEVSVARSDIVFVRADASFSEVLSLFHAKPHTRFPVCGDGLDDVIGFITVKDVLPYVGQETAFSVRHILRACTFVPESADLPSVLAHMRKNKAQMLIVTDEYGGTAGLVTLKDILEELVGDLKDEHEQAEAADILALGGGCYRLSGQALIEDVCEQTGVMCSLPNADAEDEGAELSYETVAGYVLHAAGRMPEKGETFALPCGALLRVVEADGRRVTVLELVKAAVSEKEVKT